MSDNFNRKTVEIITSELIRDKIHLIRGQKVMLDYDLAFIYGYETKYLNRQVKRNIERFEGDDFMFQLTEEEFLRCQNGTSKMEKRGGKRYFPYAFTEQGVYMLMTVLKGELAIRQSRDLIRAFRAMKDYIFENRDILNQREQLKMMTAVAINSENLSKVEKEIAVIDQRLVEVEKKAEKVIMRDEISPIMLDFNRFSEYQEYLLMNGELARSKDIYQDIYSKAKKSIYILDDYIDIKTLRLLSKTRRNIEIIVFSDNVRHYLHKNDYEDFRLEFPDKTIRFIKTNKILHDRFIVIDYETEDERIYHSGASSKDAGKSITTIMELKTELAKGSMHTIIEVLMNNSELKLK